MDSNQEVNLRVLVTFKARPEDKEIITSILSKHAEVHFIDELSAEQLERLPPEVDVILTGSGLDLTQEILRDTRNLKLIQTLSAGADYIPFHSLPEKVLVCTNAGANAIAVAEHVWAMILAAAKKIIYHDQNMRKGIWKRRDYGFVLQNKTMGIIGLGNVGQSVARIAKAFGMRIFAINRSGVADMNVDFIGTPDKLDIVLQNSDVVVVAVPLTKYTRGMIGKRELNLMKSTAILVNVSRGEVIDQKALYEHLRDNPNFIACLDVWWRYPSKDLEPVYQDYPFHELPNVIMTPHIAGFAPEIRDRVLIAALENIIKYIRGEKPKNVVDRSDYL